MMRLRWGASLALAAILAACATTDGSSRDPALAANEGIEPGSPNEMICENEMRTGERIPRRVCLTRAEREALRRDGVEAFDDESVRALRVNPGGG